MNNPTVLTQLARAKNNTTVKHRTPGQLRTGNLAIFSSLTWFGNNSVRNFTGRIKLVRTILVMGFS